MKAVLFIDVILLFFGGICSMSKIYSHYQKLKSENERCYYLFECGVFYLFVGQDAVEISKIIPLKLTHLNEEIYKCGFPIKSLNKYLELFQENNLDVVIIHKEEKQYTLDFCLDIIKRLKQIDINSITPMEALKLLEELKQGL